MFLPFDEPPTPAPAPDAAAGATGEVTPESGGVTLLLGPPRGGKTGVLLERYVAALRAGWAAGRVGACLWLTPNRLSRAAVTADLAAAVGGPLLGHGVKTFENLTDDLLAELPGPPGRRLGPVSRRRILRAVIEAALDRGELPHFARIARTGGFLGLLDRQVRAWKYEEVWPEDVDVSAGPARRELASLYAAYQAWLQAPPGGGRPLFDAEGRVWAARTRLAEADDDGRASQLDLLVADGFTTFTKTQRDLLAALAGRSAAAVLALPDEPPAAADGTIDGMPHRPALFSAVAGTRADLLARFAGAAAEAWHVPRRPDDALGHLAARLFDESDPPPEPRGGLPAGRIKLVEAGTRSAEVRAAVAGVKRALLADARADRVVVAARSPGEYAEEFARLADAAGVPLDLERPEPLARRPAVRALLAPWRLEAGRWEYAPLVRLLRDPCFAFDRGDGGGEEEMRGEGVTAGAASRAVARCLRYANVGEGRRAVVKVAEALSPDREDRGPGDARDAPCEQDRRLAARAVARLDAALAPARDAADFAGWVGRLRTLEDSLDFAPPAASRARAAWEDDAADLAAAWAVLEDAAAEIAAERGDDGDGPDEPGPPLTLGEFLSAADELLGAASVAGPPPVPGGVAFVDAETARTAGCDHLFLLGLGEGQFPAPPPKRDAAADPDAADPDAHARAEMLLFFGVVTRPVETLTLSWPTLDDAARRLFEGPFVTAVRDLFAPGVLTLRTADALDPVPAMADVLTADDARVSAVRALLAGDAAPLAEVLADPREGPAGRAALGAVRMLAARTRTAGLTAFDGKLSARNRRVWRSERPKSHEFSTGELEDFAANPHRYFLARVLNADRPEVPALAANYAARGSAMHAALAVVHREADPREDGTALTARLHDFLDDLSPRRATFARWHDGLWETEKAVLAHLAEQYGPQADGYRKETRKAWGCDPRPAWLEVAFGDRTPEEEGEELVDRRPAAVFGTNGDAVRVTGRIDRIDAGLTAEGPAYHVIDYKTGDTPGFRPEHVAAGLRLQLALYAVAAKRLGLVEPAAEPHGLFYWKVGGKGCGSGVTYGGKKTVADLWDDLPATLDAAVPRLAAAIRGGAFPVNPDEGGGPKWLGGFARVSRAAAVRSVAGRLNKWPPDWLAPAGIAAAESADGA